MTGRISEQELQDDCDDVLRRVSAGESFEVTVNGEAVALLSPPAQVLADLRRDP